MRLALLLSLLPAHALLPPGDTPPLRRRSPQRLDASRRALLQSGALLAPAYALLALPVSAVVEKKPSPALVAAEIERSGRERNAEGDVKEHVPRISFEGGKVVSPSSRSRQTETLPPGFHLVSPFLPSSLRPSPPAPLSTFHYLVLLSLSLSISPPPPSKRLVAPVLSLPLC